MDAARIRVAREAIGFMPDAEGEALYELGLEGASVGPLLEIGSYAGKSAVYLGAAAEERGTVLFSIDHHRGSEEHQPGWEYRDERLVDASTGRYNTLPEFQRTLESARLEDSVIGIVARAELVAAHWQAPLGLVFIDGSHTDESAHRDYDGWAHHVVPPEGDRAGGLLAIHDVFEDPSRGGQAPFRIFQRALDSGVFTLERLEGSLRALRRTGAGKP
jgi:predicted O-methyltransferase YrrM